MLEIVLMTNGVRTTVHGTQTTAKLSEEVNTSSKFEFTINYGDESFDNVFPKITRVIAYDTLPNQVVFEGYVYSSIPKASSEGAKKQVSAIHISAMLCDACVVGFEDDSGNLSTMASRLLGIYNATARTEDRIEIGSAPVSGGHPEVVHMASATCWDALTQIVVTEAGYSFRTRYANGSWYLDIADDFGEIATEDLIYGVNLTEISQELNASELYTRIIPIGGASYIPDNKINPTMSSIHGTEGMPLTLYKYFGNSDPEASRIYIANEDLEKKYPVTAKIVQYDNIVATDDTDFATAQGNLYSKAAYDAARLTDIIESYKANAIDLARAGYDYDTIELNKMYRVINNKIGIDTYLQVTSKKTDYSNPAKSDLTFGGVGAKASKWMSRKGKSTDQKISSVASGSYKTTNTRMGGMSMRNQSKSDYESASSHDANTLYTVSDAGTGKVELYLGDTKISGEEGGGVEVQTAVLYDAANLHDYTVDTELMVDISANTKLYYGASNRMFVMQGMLCFLGPSSLPSGSTFTDLLDDLLTANSDYIAPAYSGITSYYTSSGVVYRAVADISVFPYQVNVESDGRARWWFKLVSVITKTNMNTSASSTNTYTSTVVFYTNNITDITEYGLLLYCSQVGAGSPATAFDSYIPYGYAGASDSPSSSTDLRAVLVYKNNNPNVDKWNANYNGTISPSGGSQTYTNVRVGSYAPLSSAETAYMLGATQRSEPVTPNNGGGA
jgi:hypothetical protein